MQWDPYTRPIITEKQGFVKFIDLNKDTLEETTSQDTGMTSQVVKDWRIPGSSKQQDYRPRMEIVDDKDKILKLANSSKAIYELPVSAVLSIGLLLERKNRKLTQEIYLPEYH